MRKEALDGHIPHIPLKEEEIFCSPHHFALTTYGSKLQGLCITYDSLSDPKMSDGRRQQVNEDVEERCQEIGLPRSKIGTIEMQLFALMQKRVDQLSSITIDKIG